VRAFGALTTHCFVPSAIAQAGYPLDPRHAGPCEALLRTLFCQTHGCSCPIVGRAHADVGSCCGPFDAHHIFEYARPEVLEILCAHDRGCGTPNPPDRADTTPAIPPNDHRPGDRRCPAM